MAVGEDSVDWPAVFTAAKIGGLKNYFIEQTWELTQKSAAYLKTLTVRTGRSQFRSEAESGDYA